MPPRTARFDVYIEGGRLVYFKRSCAPADTELLFFLHVAPADVNDLTDHRKKHGLDDVDFHFNRRGAISDGECRVTADLPKYAIRSVNTGQSVPDGETGSWNEIRSFSGIECLGDPPALCTGQLCTLHFSLRAGGRCGTPG